MIILAIIWFAPVSKILPAALIIIVSHAAIDFIKIKLLIKQEEKGRDYKVFDFALFVTDQIIHLAIILFTAHMLTELNDWGGAVQGKLLQFLTWKQLNNLAILTLLYILCLSPAGIFIKKVFVLFSLQRDNEVNCSKSTYSEIVDSSDHENDEDHNDMIKSGYLIGVLERVIILTLGLNNQLGAIGFVIAAKSIARFNQLNDREFAEKYLVGTLLSTLIALICIVIGNNALLK
jgi:hypothetical protein